MTVDLSKLKVGDSVKLRCGGVIEVLPNLKHDNYVCFHGFCWHYDGSYGDENNPLNIIEIIPKPEPVVKKYYIAANGNGMDSDVYKSKNEMREFFSCLKSYYEITITDGIPSIERVTV